MRRGEAWKGRGEERERASEGKGWREQRDRRSSAQQQIVTNSV